MIWSIVKITCIYDMNKDNVSLNKEYIRYTY